MVNNLFLQTVHNHIVHTLPNTFCALSLSTGTSAPYVKQSESLTAGMRKLFCFLLVNYSAELVLIDHRLYVLFLLYDWDYIFFV